jgi:hypothetical protein
LDRLQQKNGAIFPTIQSRIQTQQQITPQVVAKINSANRLTLSSLSMVNNAYYLSMLDQFVQSSPYTTAAIACGIKASSADFIAQKRQLRKRNDNIIIDQNFTTTTTTTTTTTLPKNDNDNAISLSTTTTINNNNNNNNNNKIVRMDIARNIAFLLYGALYQGMGQEYIYNHLYPLYFGTGTNVVTVLMKVMFDLLIQTTVLTLPVAYGIKAIIYKYSFREALRRYIEDIMNHGLLIKYFTLWGPVQCITFSIIPERYRISFIAIISFFWLIVLSTISSRVRSTAVPTTQNTNRTDTLTNIQYNIPLTTQECELVDGFTCNIDG